MDPPLLEALRSLKDTVRFEAIEHALAARAVVGHLPSLVMEDSRRPVSAVDVLLELARHRNEMFRYLDPPRSMPNYHGTQPPGSGGPPASPGRPT